MPMTENEIELENGNRIRFFPRYPSGFNPLTASSAELKHYGFPPRPNHPKAVDWYRRAWGRLGRKLEIVEPSFRVDTSRPLRRLRSSFDPDPNFSTWSGGIVFPSTGDAFAGVAAEWVVPNAYPSAPGMQNQCGIWIGLDGYQGAGQDVLVQVGIGYTVSVAGYAQIQPFYEWYPANPVYIPSLTVNAGDFIQVVITTSGPGSTFATLNFVNTTSGRSIPPLLITGSTPLAGSSAEWVVETLLLLDGSLMPDYGAVFFSNCLACGDGTGVDGGTGTALNMAVNGDELSEGIMLSPSIIESVYTGPSPPTE
jgi:Peptidase A4 family